MNTFSKWKAYFADKHYNFDNEPITAFMTLWMCFNGYYNRFHKDTERMRVCELATNKKAQWVYNCYKDEILKSFSVIPYKDEKIRTFVANTSSRFNAEYNENKCSLKDFLNAVYQIRCNLFHGQKCPFIDADVKLVKWAYENLYKILHNFNNELF